MTYLSSLLAAQGQSEVGSHIGTWVHLQHSRRETLAKHKKNMIQSKRRCHASDHQEAAISPQKVKMKLPWSPLLLLWWLRDLGSDFFPPATCPAPRGTGGAGGRWPGRGLCCLCSIHNQEKYSQAVRMPGSRAACAECVWVALGELLRDPRRCVQPFVGQPWLGMYKRPVYVIKQCFLAIILFIYNFSNRDILGNIHFK